MSKLIGNTVLYYTEKGAQVLSAKKMALLKEDEDGKYAVLDSMTSTVATLKADDGVILTIPVETLKVTKGIVVGAEVYFNEDGSVRLAVMPKVAPKPAATKPSPAPLQTGKRTGSFERPAMPTRDKH